MPSLTLRVLGDFRSEGPTDEFEFYKGENKVIRLQIINDDDSGQKFCIPADGTLEMTLSATPNDIVYNNASITIDSDDRSIISANVPASVTDDLITGMIQVKITSATKGIRIATLDYGLRKLLTIGE